MGLLEDRVGALTDSVDRLVKNLGSGGVPGGTQTVGQSAQMLQTGTTNFITSTGSVVRGTYNLNSAIEDVSKTLKIFGPVVGAVVDIFKGTMNEVQQINQLLNQAGSFGVNFGNSLSLYSSRIGQAGISMEDFNRLLQSGSKQLGGWGKNAQESANLFLANSEALRKSEQIIALEIAGIDFKHFQNQLVLSGDLMKYAVGSNQAAQEKLRGSAVEAAIEIDNMARLTGRSRQEIQKDLEKSNQSRLMEVAKMAMSPEELARYQANSPFANAFGPQLAKAFQEMSVFGGDVSTRESAEVMAGFEALAPGVRDLFAELSQTDSKARQEELKREIEFKLAAAAADKDRMRDFVALGDIQKGVARALTDTLIASQSILAGATNTYKEVNGDRTRFIQERQETARIRKEITDAIEGNKTGGLKNGEQINLLLNGLERAVAAGRTAAGDYIAELGKKAGIEISNKMDTGEAIKRIQQLQSLTGTELEELAKSMTNWTGQNLKDKPTNLPERYNMGSAKDSPMYVSVTNLTDIAPKKEAEGSKDVWGEWFGGPAGLANIREAGPEAVVPRNKTGEFISDMLGGNSGIVSGLMGNLRSSVADPSNSRAIQQALGEVASTLESLPATISSIATASTNTIATDKTTSDVVTSLEKLNTKLDSLIHAVETGAHGTVKAFKQQGNLIA